MKRRNVIKNLAGLSLLGPMLSTLAIAAYPGMINRLSWLCWNCRVVTTVSMSCLMLTTTTGCARPSAYPSLSCYRWTITSASIRDFRHSKAGNYGELALIHGCVDDPTFSYFNAMAYWHIYP